MKKALVILLLCTGSVYADSEAEVLSYADKYGYVSETQLIEFFLERNDVPYWKLLNRPGGSISMRKKREAVKRDLQLINKHLSKPYKAESVHQLINGQTITTDTTISKPSPFSRDKLALRGKPEDIGKTLKNSSASAFSYIDDNGPKAQEVWSTSGAFILPFDKRYSQFKRLWIGPALYWNVLDTNAKDPSDEIEELQLSVPFRLKYSNPRAGRGDEASVYYGHVVGGKAYYHTDFGFDGATVGADLSYEPDFLLSMGNCRLRVGHYYAFKGSKDSSQTAAYRLRIVPKITWDTVAVGGNHTTRMKNDEWLRAGALTELAIRPFGEDAPFEFSASYEFFAGIDGDEKWADLFTAKATYWFTQDTFGVSASYENGETPVSKKELDLFKIGLDAKF